MSTGVGSPIIVTGATGHIGSWLLRQLVAKGVPVRALSRHVLADSVPPGVEAVRADLNDPASLASAMAGGASMFLLTPPDERLVGAQENALRAARAAGISRVVKLSALGASDHTRSTVARWHYEVEQELLRGGFDWTILRPHYFMDNLLDQAEEVRTKGWLRSTLGPARIPFVDSRDLAEVAAVTLTSEGHSGRKYVLTGSEALGFPEVAERLSRLLGRTVEVHEESLDEATAAMAASGRAPWEIDSFRALWTYQRAEGPTAKISPDVERLLARPPRSMTEFLRDHLESFRRAPAPR